MVGGAAVVVVRLAQVGAVVGLAEAGHHQGGAHDLRPLRESVVHPRPLDVPRSDGGREGERERGRERETERQRERGRDRESEKERERESFKPIKSENWHGLGVFGGQHKKVTIKKDGELPNQRTFHSEKSKSLREE